MFIENLKNENVVALKKGLVNLERHISNIKKFGLTPIVAINSFILDTKKSEWQEIELPYSNPKCDLVNKSPYETSEFYDQIFYKYEEKPGIESDFYSFTHIDVQIIFYDGESSEIKKFTRPPTR